METVLIFTFVQCCFSVPPMMWVPAQQTSALRGSSITLTCSVEAHPEALTFWEHGGRMVQPGDRFFTSTKQGNPSYKVKYLQRNLQVYVYTILTSEKEREVQKRQRKMF